ncbi:hypothetical protein ACIRPX_21290 [Streptomyces sp. NPDC101225]|uniref:hypothetical protein n=1 Tax=Streptomyces sp. NPDC101225 TaxID=3366135 RepID=UPI00380B578E
MTYARTGSVCGAVTLCAALLAGCTDGGGTSPGTTRAATPSDARSGGGAKAGASTGTAGGALPVASPTEQADPAKQPRTVREAREFVRKMIADPQLLGMGAVRATPYESDPSTWAVLGHDCVWRREALPKDVLATLTRYFEIPASGTKGSVRMSATVTVHRTALDAAWEQAGMLEEAVGCPEQTLRPGERLTGLDSTAVAWGENGNTTSDDSLSEVGKCVSDTQGGPYAYSWTQSTFGSVVVGASVCEGQGRDTSEISLAARMLVRVQAEIAVPVAAASGSPEPEPGPSSGTPDPGDAKGDK